LNGIDYEKFSTRGNEKEMLKLRDLFGVPKNNILIGMVSSLTAVKGHTVALKILKKLVEKRITDVRLIIVGDGPQFESIKNQVESMKLDKYVIFTGRRSDVKNILDILDIYLMTSLKEGMPISLLEAMGSGLPVVTSNVGDIKHAIVHGENGFIHEPDDISGFGDSILSLIKDKDLRLKIGISAQRTVKEKYSARTMAGNYCKLYRKVIAQSA
jgi:glycosyltransferase involved in cell wall biosynthesis